MDINPIKALKESFENLIVEHGSAKIRADRIEFLKDQLSFAERETTKLTIKNSELQSKILSFQAEIGQLRAKITSLEKENAELKKQIKIYDEPNHNNLLDEQKLADDLYDEMHGQE